MYGNHIVTSQHVFLKLEHSDILLWICILQFRKCPSIGVGDWGDPGHYEDKYSDGKHWSRETSADTGPTGTQSNMIDICNKM